MLTSIMIGIALLLAPTPAESSATAGRDLMRAGQELYRQGQMGEALLKFEEAVKAGAEDGEMFYQMGFAYKAVRQDAAKSREFMAKAAPLLEKVVAPPAHPGPAPFYYLSAIYVNDLADSARGTEVAKRGVAEASEGRFAKLTDGESLFQIARLYTLAGRRDEAIPFYEKGAAALEASKSPNKAYLISALEQLAGFYAGKGDLGKAADLTIRLADVDPAHERQRLAAGRMLLKAGRHQDALSVLRNIRDDDLSTEANYLARVIKRYLELGSQAVSPDAAKLDDNGLVDAIVASAKKLGEIRKKEEEAAKDLPPVGSVIPATPLPEEGVPPPRRRVRFKDPNHPTMEEYDAFYGIVTPPPNLPPPPSAERMAADREFFGLLVEYAGRGRPLQEMAVSKGIMVLIFR